MVIGNLVIAEHSDLRQKRDPNWQKHWDGRQSRARFVMEKCRRIIEPRRGGCDDPLNEL